MLKQAVLELKTEEFADTFAQMQPQDGKIEYVTDCTIDTDLELMFPSTYVPQEGERITLYRELDSIDSDRDVAAFESRLEDRFGRIPDMARELIRIVPLRRAARQLGIEKIVLKQGAMHLFFVGDENLAYYQSPAFGRILAFVQGEVERCHLREVRGRRSLVVDRVPTVSEALALLRSI